MESNALNQKWKPFKQKLPTLAIHLRVERFMKCLSKSYSGNGISQTLNRLTLLALINPNARYHTLKENSSLCPSSSLGPVKGVGPFFLCCTPSTLATQCPETHAVLSENTIRLQSKELYVDQRQSPSKLAARADYLQI